jgi:hypothetical protein
MFQAKSTKLSRNKNNTLMSFSANPHFLQNGIDDWFLYVVTFLLG